MESPVKKLSFDKENKPFDADLATLEAQMDAKHNAMKTQEKETEEKQQLLDEPILQENPGRFVLFPIKYHEVSSTT